MIRFYASPEHAGIQPMMDTEFLMNLEIYIVETNQFGKID
jgi:hypothetical protein